eukprot:TRINITY_DN85_c0_g1_i6.p2 TRINITY_DN85_c0_g1~~TRINITY_DN85_c0_g1_i6.p2  ORF type:complete len:106 (-),score=17.29 TRINITY_DN85_c0_g1_i6:307-624(-)
MSQARLFLLAVCCVASVLSRSYPSPATAGCQDDSDCYGYGKICPRDFEMCVCNEHNICDQQRLLCTQHQLLSTLHQHQGTLLLPHHSTQPLLLFRSTTLTLVRPT